MRKADRVLSAVAAGIVGQCLLANTFYCLGQSEASGKFPKSFRWRRKRCSKRFPCSCQFLLSTGLLGRLLVLFKTPGDFFYLLPRRCLLTHLLVFPFLYCPQIVGEFHNKFFLPHSSVSFNSHRIPIDSHKSLCASCDKSSFILSVSCFPFN